MLTDPIIIIIIIYVQLCIKLSSDPSLQKMI